MNILIDTNAYSYLFRGDARAMGALERASIIHLSVFVIGELMEGFKGGQKEKWNMEQLKAFLAKPSVYELHTSRTTAELFAVIKRALRAKGTPIPINDVWIAAHALETKAHLLTFDRHFEQIEGLQIVSI